MESQQETGSGAREEATETIIGQEGEEHEIIEGSETGTHWKLSIADEIVFYGLIILSLIGAVIAQVSVDMGRTFWLAMIPIAGAATIYIEWADAGVGEIRWLRLLGKQILHWGSLLVAIELLNLLAHFGRINNTAVSSVTLLLLAQTTFLIGVHRDWRFCVVAIFQAFCLIVLTYLETYIWLVLVAAGGIIALGIYFHRKFPQTSAARRR